MSVVTKIGETTWLNEFGGLVSNSGHASPDIMINVNKISKWYGDFQIIDRLYRACAQKAMLTRHQWSIR